MTALSLLKQVAAAGVQIRVVGADLAIRPKGTLPDALRTRLVARKRQVLELLDPEVRWRAEVLYPQVPSWPQPVLSLLVRHNVRRDVNACFSCDVPLTPLDRPPACAGVSRAGGLRGWCSKTGPQRRIRSGDGRADGADREQGRRRKGPS